MPKHNETLCRICGEPDDSNNAEGPCLACQVDQQAHEFDLLWDMVRDGDLSSGIAQTSVIRKKTRRSMDRAR